MEKNQTLSPMMTHYVLTKEKYKDAILFYRLGDFYEMFYEDAILVSKVLDLTLTGKNCGTEERAPMCGIPYHAAESYIAKLLKQGYKIAICEQLTEAQKGKQVERDVIRVITPGTVTSDLILDENKNNYILCVSCNNDTIGIAYSDITTGDFFTTELIKDSINSLNSLVTQLCPAEIICDDITKDIINTLPINKMLDLPKPYVYLDKSFIFDNACNTLKNHFGITVLSVYELNEAPQSVIACGALMDYLNDTQKVSLKQIQRILKLDSSKYMILDAIARRNLEITETMREHKKSGSLLSVLDATSTSMGARLLRQWLECPLKDSNEINFRLDAVDEILKNLVQRNKLKDILRELTDIERLTSKIGMKTIMPKECIKLYKSLVILPKLKNLLIVFNSQLIKNVYNNLDELTELKNLIFTVIKEEPAVHLKDGGYIKEGFNGDLDKLIELQTNSHAVMASLESSERIRTGIDSLRIKFNKVYGYYFEISTELADKVPLDYHRKQTVSNFDRYFTEELKNLENKIVSAQDSSIRLEQEIYLSFKDKLLNYIPNLQVTSKSIAVLDCLLSLANVAAKNNYVRPKILPSINEINIVEGRHPVVEESLNKNEFIANDTYINDTTDKILVITGPNMAGKSTYMRQVAIITLMAHIGSFVPAKSAEIAITDRIFTRVGASDDLASGQSTFMVEMTEMANILQNATDKSLVILDEIGRGTSTFDGLSIAWAIVEHFTQKKSKVLFATHYHELTELEGMLDGIKNYKINVKEFNNTIVFLRKIVRGGANRSFGIEVASLAGIPDKIIERAKQISHNIAEQDFKIKLTTSNLPKEDVNLKNVSNNNQIILMLKDIDINRISPIEAFDILQDLIKKIKD